MKWTKTVRVLLTLLCAVILVLALAGCGKQEQQREVGWEEAVEEPKEKAQEAPPAEEQKEETKQMPTVTAPSKKEIEATKAHGKYTAVIETELGTIECLLRGDLAPLTVTNFVKLSQAGFYDGLNFHRVEDWVIQGGDPEGTGMGGPGYSIKLEIAKDLSNSKGAIAMARSSDPNSAGSQFYILKQKADWLDGQYAVFGNVMKGLDVVEKIQIGTRINKVTIK